MSRFPPPRPAREEAFRAPESDRARRAMAEHLAREQRIKTSVLRSAVLVASGLFALKLAAAWATGSLAVLASALDSLLDGAISAFNWYSVREADRPPDPEHPFGHGKVESLVSFGQALLLTAVGVVIALQALERLGDPRPVEASHWGIAAMVVSGVAAWALARTLRRRGRETDSPVLAAEQLHYSMDFLSHAGVVLTLVLQEWTGLWQLDPFMSLLISGYILWQVRGVGFEALQDLMDRELPPEVQERIVEVIEAHRPQVLAWHGLRTRRAGARRIVNLHLVLCKAVSFETSHDIVDHVETELVAAVPRSDVTIHADPCGEYCPGEDRCPWARMLSPRR